MISCCGHDKTLHVISLIGFPFFVKRVRCLKIKLMQHIDLIVDENDNTFSIIRTYEISHTLDWTTSYEIVSIRRRET